MNKTFRRAIADFFFQGNTDKIGGIGLGAFMKKLCNRSNFNLVYQLELCS
ncbi:MAG: hypothetical protein WBG73_24340 [Coleofasciculaceae cyanobacterium]